MNATALPTAPEYRPTSPLDTSSSAPAPRILSLRQFGRDLAYLAIAFPIATAVFSVSTLLLHSGIGAALIAGIGLIFLFGALWFSRAAAWLERTLIAWVDPRKRAPEPYTTLPEGSPWWRFALYPFREKQMWIDVAWGLLSFPISLVSWLIMMMWGPGAVATLVGLAFPRLRMGMIPPEAADFLGVDLWTVALPAALVMLVTFPLVTRGLALLQTQISDLILNSRGRTQALSTRVGGLTAQVSDLRESRTAAGQAESEALRRLERDIHDGPQQRLVRLQMDLARARRQADRSPEETARLIDEATLQAEETLAELRRLSRGIAPPIIVDRGLDAALRQSAGIATVPVQVTSTLIEPDGSPVRLPAAVETAAYFTASEALANIGKHAHASTATLDARHDLDAATLTLVITDDGSGGAQVTPGGGLAGIGDRVRGAGGTLRIDSPVDHGTRIEVMLPCGS